MRLFATFKNTALSYLKLFSLWDFQAHFSKIDKLKLFAVFTINIINSLAKILAPAAFAKAIEMLALSEETIGVGPYEVDAKELLYLSSVFSIFIKSESYIKNLILGDVDNRIIKNNAAKLVHFEHNVSLSMHTKLKQEVSRSLMETINTQSRLSSEVMAVLYQGIVDIGVGSTLIWYIYGRIMGGVFLLYCGIDFFLLNNLVVRITKGASSFEKMNKKLSKFINREFETLSNEELIRMFNHQILEIELTERALDKYIIAKKHFHLSENFGAILKLIPYFIATLAPISLMIKEEISLDDLDHFIFLVSYINTFGGNVLGLSQSIKTCLRAMDSYNRVTNMLTHHQTVNNVISNYPYQMASSLSLDIHFKSPEIVFENVYFTYPQAAEPTLKGISFKLSAGQKLGIVGRSNAGKSTIVKLLYGFYQVDSGCIKINGIPINSIPAEILCELFCCVPQNADFFKGKSLKYNVLYGYPLTSFVNQYLASEKIAKKGEIDSDENTMQKANVIFSDAMRKVKLDDIMHENASEKAQNLPLSGGQRQRLNIARAIVRSSKIFVFDEATASLDAFTESEVLQNINECTHKKSVMMITHRLPTIMDADQVVVLENGEIAEQDTPTSLLERKGLFYNYWQTQMCNR